MTKTTTKKTPATTKTTKTPAATGTTKTRRQALGAFGEDVAARHLREQGMVVLDRNWRCDEGEIDLVLRDGPVLVVCEVKTRSSLACGTPHEAVPDSKLDRLQRLGQRWLAAQGFEPPGGTRVDLVAVLRPRTGPTVVEHVRAIG